MTTNETNTSQRRAPNVDAHKDNLDRKVDIEDEESIDWEATVAKTLGTLTSTLSIILLIRSLDN
jgi:hypothetical protein